VPTDSIPKGSQRKEFAQKYRCVLLSVEGQQCFAQSRFAGPSNRTVKLSPGLARLLPYSDNVERMYLPDTDVVAKRLPEWPQRRGCEITR